MSATIADVLSGAAQPNRKPNYSGVCERCSQAFEKYVRPSHPRPRFCAKACSIRWLGTAPEIKAKIKRFGSEHHGWLGDKAKKRSGRTRAKRLYPVIGPCERCGSPQSERHHRDGNTLNNAPDNVAPLCRKCHAADHVGGFRGRHAS